LPWFLYRKLDRAFLAVGQRAPIRGDECFLFAGSATLPNGYSGGTVAVTVPASALAAGTYTLAAIYSGDSNYSGSTSTTTVSQVVTNLTATTATLSAVTAPNPSNATQPLTFNVAVSGGTPTGTVEIVDTSNSNHVVASGTLVAGNNGSINLTIPAQTIFAGLHNLQAVYLGDSNYAPSTPANTVAQQVNLVITAVAVNGNPGNTTITSASESGTGLVTITTAAANGFIANQAVKITVTGQTGFDGIFDVTPLSGTNGTEFTYQDNNASNLPSASAGTAVGALVGVQRSMVTSIVYVFSEPVTTLTASDFTIAVHSGTTTPTGTLSLGTKPTLNVSNPSGDGVTWLVTFSGSGVAGGSIANGVYDITANTGSITSLANPTQTAQARATDTFARLFGNATGQTTAGGVTTLTVNGTALTLLENEFDAAPGQMAYKEAYFDVTGGGTNQINGTDLTLGENNFNKSYTGFLATI
jgi:large repetitive protein